MLQDARYIKSDQLRRTLTRPFHSVFMHYASACFIGAFVTDIAYWRTYEVTWETFSDWLLSAGLLVAVVSIVLLLVDLWRGWRFRAASAWVTVLGFVVGVILEVPNAFVHGRDGYTAVVPEGLTLSLIVVAVLAFSGIVAAFRPIRSSERAL
jgi:uncharacterized membrane protein